MSAESGVAIVAPGEIFGGAERQILVLAAELRRRGQSFHLFLLYDGPLARAARSAGFPVAVIGSGSRLDWLAIRNLRRALRSIKCSVIHAHGYKAAVIGGLAARSTGIRFIKTEHGLPERTDGSWRSRLRQNVVRRVENMVCRVARATIVYVTEDLQRRCAGEHGAFDTRTIHNGIEPATVEAGKRPDMLPVQGCHVAVVGRLEPVKGVEFAIRAWTSPAVGPDIFLHVVGTGPLEPGLIELVERLAISDRVTLHGFRRDVIPLTAHVDMLLIPSLHEGLPYALMEAVVLGTPVVASNVGGMRELLEHEVTALLVPPGDSDGLAAAVARMAADAALRARLAHAARTRLLKIISAEAMTDAYMRLYDGTK